MRGQSAWGSRQRRNFAMLNFVTLDPESNSIAILVKHLAGNSQNKLY
jgi:hypothetical protein